jgi:hypothetical protein
MKWIRDLFARRALERDLADEIRQHLDEKIDNLILQGLSRDEASRLARREFGNVTLLEDLLASDAAMQLMTRPSAKTRAPCFQRRHHQHRLDLGIAGDRRDAFERTFHGQRRCSLVYSRPGH